MRRNVGGYDRIVRGVAGTWLLAVGIAAYLDGQRERAAVGVIAGSGLLFNAIFRFCGGNLLLGIDTTDGGPDSDSCRVE
ncbi:DUF2892 domain-containing protein [Natrialbaceae archaeon GCM10025810]|uniref:YgaP family membrane protein n=1 Tax=Halovalidus salilacus TaxID=3075124 RepID=UPI003609A5F8